MSTDVETTQLHMRDVGRKYKRILNLYFESHKDKFKTRGKAFDDLLKQAIKNSKELQNLEKIVDAD